MLDVSMKSVHIVSIAIFYALMQFCDHSPAILKTNGPKIQTTDDEHDWNLSSKSTLFCRIYVR